MKLTRLTDVRWIFEHENDPFYEPTDTAFNVEKAKRDYVHVTAAVNSLIGRINAQINQLVAATKAVNRPILDDWDFKKAPPSIQQQYTVTIPLPARRPMAPRGVSVMYAHLKFFSVKHLQEFPTYMPIVHKIRQSIGEFDSWSDILRKLATAINKYDQQQLKAKLNQAPTKNVDLPSVIPQTFGNFINPYLATPPGANVVVTDRYAGPVSGYAVSGREKRIMAGLREILQSVGEDMELVYAASLANPKGGHVVKSFVCTGAGGKIVWVSHGPRKGWSHIWDTNVNSLFIAGQKRGWKITSPIASALERYIKSAIGQPPSTGTTK
jgi:hypothetical protein